MWERKLWEREGKGRKKGVTEKWYTIYIHGIIKEQVQLKTTTKQNKNTQRSRKQMEGGAGLIYRSLWPCSWAHRFGTPCLCIPS